MHLRTHIPSLLLTFALVGCSSGEHDDTADSIQLAFIPKTSSNLVFAIGNDGAQFRARYLAHQEDLDIEVEYLASPELDPASERDLIQQAVEEGKDGLLVSCIDDSISDAIDDAVDAGVPVITFDSDCPDSKRLGFYSMVSQDTGAKGADALASAMGSGPKTVGILTGRAGAENLENRVAGFRDRLAAEYPDVSVVVTANCDETAADCGPAVEDAIIDQYPELDGLFVVGLWGLQAACTCSDTGMTCQCEDSQMPKWKAAAKGKLKTVAYDTLPFELELVNQGYINVLLGQKYFGWGHETVALMVDHLTTGHDVDTFIDSGFDVVCAENSAEMMDKWLAHDFSSALEVECEL